jgi:dipeptidyl-peptidase-4
MLSAGSIHSQPARRAKDVPLDSRYLRDHAETRGFMLGRPVKPTPTPDGKAVLFLRSQPRIAKLSLYEFDVLSGKTRELLTPEQVLKGAEENLSPEEKARRERMRVSVGGFTGFQLSDDGQQILLSLSGKLYVVERAKGAIRELKTGPGTVLDPKFSPDGAMVSYVRDHDLYVYDLAKDKESAVTKGGTEEVSHGLAEFVAQEEMGRFTGYWWSPDSKHLAYEEANARDVEVWHVADPIHPGQKPHASFYPRPGKRNVKVRLGLISLKGGPTTWVDWDEKKYPYLTTVKWPKGGPLLLAVQTREQNELVLLQADRTTGKTTTLLREVDPAWVNIHQDVPRWLPEGAGFLWITERDGGPQLELRSTNGRLRRVVVAARDGFQGLVAVDPKGTQVVYNASTDPTQSHLYRISTEAWGEPVAITKVKGLHTASYARNHSIYVHTARLFGFMPRSTVHKADAEDTLVGELPSVAEEPPFDPRVELLQVGSGPAYHAAVILPCDYDAKRKYPVMVDVYGGPHHLHVLAAKNRWLLDQWYADQGFIVVAIDGRGTPGRGRDWERAIYKKFGSVPLEDQVAGLRALAERYPSMDLERVGIDGWSFGGYMAALAVLRRPDVFKVAVAGAPVVDWLDYDTHYTERYLGIPPTDDAAYKDANLLTYAAGLQRPLLLLHGTADDNVYFRHSLRLADSLFRAGKDFEVLPLSGLTHMVPDPLVMERLHSRIARFLQKHLAEPQSSAR